ncbi:hypothetical protein VT06_16940, partial [Arsukibacterium sp. MJ3]|uniref:hypothetical protein n=1 Tax=Arsukibacterium sp. MJ3 TaxID=1632859 RepID=UPI0006273BB6
EVYLIGEDDRLYRQQVVVEFQQRGIAAISAGISEGDRVILDDLAYAIAGMRVIAGHYQELQNELLNTAKGSSL